MTTAAVKILHDAIAAAGGSVGFKKRGSSWYCQETDAILVINPQGSQYGSQYFLNLGVYWRSLGAKPAPKEEECHVRGRIESVLPKEEKQEVERSLDFEDSSIDDVTRRTVLRDALLLHAIPVLKRCSTADGLREEYYRGTLKSFLIARALAEMLRL